MTRSHHQSRSDSHRWRTDLNEEAMVLPYSKRVPPKSFVRSQSWKTVAFSKSRPARTPPSTFLFLHLYLSNSLEPGGSYPLVGSSASSVPTTINNRQLSAVYVLGKSGAFGGTTPCLGRGPKPRRAQWPSYRPALTDLSTGLFNKSSLIRNQTCAAQKVPSFHDLVPHLSHNPATFWV